MSVTKAVQDLLKKSQQQNKLFEEKEEELNTGKMGDVGGKAADLASKDKSKSSVAAVAGDTAQPKQGSSKEAEHQDFDEEDIGDEAAKPVSKDTTLPKSKGDAKSVRTQASAKNEEKEDLDEDVLDEGTVHPADAHRILNATGGIDKSHFELSGEQIDDRMKQAKEAGYVAKGDSPTGRSKAYRTTLHLQRQAAKYKPRMEEKEDLDYQLDEARASQADDETARELYTHGSNTGHLYTNSATPIINNLARKKAAGKYDDNLASKAWEHHAKRSAHSYVKEYGTPYDDPNKIFNAATRRKAAEYFKDHYDEEINEKAEELKNKKQMKIKEDVTTLDEQLNLIFGEDLSEEFKTKASSIFESAVIARVNDEMEEIRDAIEEEYQDKAFALEEEYESRLMEMKETLSENIDDYINYAINHWLEENRIGVETGIKHEILENFVSGLHTLFTENYIDVPDEKMDLVKAIQEENEELKNEMNNVIAESMKYEEKIIELTKEKLVDQVTESLTDTEAEKFGKLIEGIEFDTEELYMEKLRVIKESHFSKKQAQQKNDLDETPNTSSPLFEGNDVMSKYAQVISRTVKRT